MKDNRDSNENWQAVMLSLVDGTISHLAPSTSVKVRMRLASFKGEVLCAQDARARKRLERELEEFLQSFPSTRAAVKRHIVPNVKTVCECAVKTMRQMERVLKRSQSLRQEENRSRAGKCRARTSLHMGIFSLACITKDEFLMKNSKKLTGR